MPSFELTKLQAVTGPRALSETDRSPARLAAGAQAPQASNGVQAAGVSLEVNATVNTTKPPVNSDRVAEIRSALKDGSYPLVPAEIADAIIAAQISFGIEQ